jgi:hypothetical protein
MPVPTLTDARRVGTLGALAVRDSVVRGLESVVVRPPKLINGGIDAGVRWLCLTHDVTGRRGSSKGYSLLKGWAPAFPETTGYIIGTLLEQARRTGDESLERRAREMADWEVEVQCADGGVMEGLLTNSPKPSTVFNTGMVIHGWLDLADHSGRDDHLLAAVRAGDFLRANQSGDGCWTGAAEYFGIPHTYCSRVSWALVRLATATGNAGYEHAARRQLDWVVREQRENGWFDWAAFKPGRDPNTHGLAYTLRGLLESAALIGDDGDAYLTAAVRTAEVLMRKLEVHGGWLPATWNGGWEPTARYECLTGTVQLGGVFLRLYELTGDARLFNAGLKAVERAAGHQSPSPRPEMRGALPGSFPTYGRYAPLQFPNWATKFLVDSLMLRERLLPA